VIKLNHLPNQNSPSHQATTPLPGPHSHPLRQSALSFNKPRYPSLSLNSVCYPHMIHTIINLTRLVTCCPSFSQLALSNFHPWSPSLLNFASPFIWVSSFMKLAGLVLYLYTSCYPRQTLNLAGGTPDNDISPGLCNFSVFSFSSSSPSSLVYVSGLLRICKDTDKNL
jgi:hypothetical protein